MTQAEVTLIKRESSFKVTAKNPHSTAFGLWQGLDGIRNKYCKQVGIDPNTIIAEEQITCMRQYISQRYGTPEKALNFHLANGWY